MRKPFFRTLLPTGFIGLFIYYYLANPEAIQSIRGVSPSFIVVALFFQLASLVINDLVTKTIIQKMGTKISFSEGLYAAFISNFGNYFLPLTGGAALRAIYLKRNHNFSYKNFIVSMYGMYIINFFSTSIIALLCLGYIKINYSVSVPLLTVLMMLLFLGTLSLSSARIRIDEYVINMFSRIPVRILQKFISRVQKIVVGWKRLSKDKRLLAALICFTLMNAALRAIFYAVVFSYLGHQVSIALILLYNVLISLSLYLTITPGSIGVRETILLVFGSAIGFTQESILAVNLLDRVTTVMMLFIMFIWFTVVKKEHIKV